MGSVSNPAPYLKGIVMNDKHESLDKMVKDLVNAIYELGGYGDLNDYDLNLLIKVRRKLSKEKDYLEELIESIESNIDVREELAENE